MNKYTGMSDKDLQQAGRQILIDVARKAAHNDATILCCPIPNGEMAALDFEHGMDDYDLFDYYLDESELDNIRAAAYMRGRDGIDVIRYLDDIETKARIWSMTLVLKIITKSS